VTSPTFVLVNVPAPGWRRLYHEMLPAAVLQAEDSDSQPMLVRPLVVEWADRIRPSCRATPWVTAVDQFRPADMVFTGRGNRYLPLMAAFRKQLYGVRCCWRSHFHRAVGVAL
jgi:hypothetical protein